MEERWYYSVIVFQATFLEARLVGSTHTHTNTRVQRGSHFHGADFTQMSSPAGQNILGKNISDNVVLKKKKEKKQTIFII